MKNLKFFGLALISFLALSSCSSDDDATVQTTATTQQLNIVGTAQATPNLSLLVDAVIKADLVDALSASGQRTVFAPTNAAFTTFLEANGFVDTNGNADLDMVPTAVLTQVLLNHVIDGSNLLSTDLAGTTGYANTLADGPENTKLSIYFDGTSGVELNGISEVSSANITTSNGIVHIVDTVIDLPTIATFATANPNLSILVDALSYADTGMPTIDYIDSVSDADFGPITVFAPTNAAFADLLMELNINELTDLTTAQVDSVLLLHIVNNVNVESTELMSGTVTTLGGDLTLDAPNLTLTDPDARVSNILPSLVDIQATNGIVHAIDQVLTDL